MLVGKQGHSGAVRALAASPLRVFSGSDDTTIKVWDSRTLQCLKTLEGHEDNVRVLAVGNKHVFSGSWDKTIRCEALSCLESLSIFYKSAVFGGAIWSADGRCWALSF